jgi:hypothetical protein
MKNLISIRLTLVVKIIAVLFLTLLPYFKEDINKVIR